MFIAQRVCVRACVCGEGNVDDERGLAGMLMEERAYTASSSCGFTSCRFSLGSGIASGLTFALRRVKQNTPVIVRTEPRRLSRPDTVTPRKQ